MVKEVALERVMSHLLVFPCQSPSTVTLFSPVTTW